MSTITVHLRGLSGSVDLEVPEGATVADAVEQAGVNESLAIRSGGATLSGDTPLSDEQVLVATAPEAKHGSR